MADVNIRNEIKAEIAKSGWTLTDIVKQMNLLHPEEIDTIIKYNSGANPPYEDINTAFSYFRKLIANMTVYNNHERKCYYASTTTATSNYHFRSV